MESVSAQAASQLAGELASPGILVAPGVYDVVSARLVETAGFSAAYLTGSGVSLSCTGIPDLGLMSFGEVLDRLDQVADGLSIPVIADADTGYGGPLNVYRTVRAFDKHGAAGVQIEDQVDPKRCGHELGRRCVSIKEMQAKIHAALDARLSEDLVIIARTDARTSEGLSASIERGVAYAEAGADVVFVESVESVDEMRMVTSEVPQRSMVNMVEGGRTPLLDAHSLERIGYRLVIFPNSVLRVVCRQVGMLLDRLRETGSTNDVLDSMISHSELWDLFGSEWWVEREASYNY